MDGKAWYPTETYALFLSFSNCLVPILPPSICEYLNKTAPDQQEQIVVTSLENGQNLE